MTKSFSKGLLSVFLSIYASFLLADTTPPPFEGLVQNLIVTDSVYSPGKGVVQTFIGMSYLNRPGAEQDVLFPTYFSYGITEDFQISLSANSFLFHNINDTHPFSTLDSITLGLQNTWMNIKNSNIDAGLIFEYTYPTGNINNGINDGFAIYEPALVLARDFPSLNYSQLFGEFGFLFQQRIKESNIPDNNEPLDHDFYLNLGYLFPVGNVVRYDIEVNWINGQWNHNGIDNELYVTPGIILELSDTLEIDLGCSVGLTPTADHADVVFRISYSS